MEKAWLLVVKVGKGASGYSLAKGFGPGSLEASQGWRLVEEGIRWLAVCGFSEFRQGGRVQCMLEFGLEVMFGYNTRWIERDLPKWKRGVGLELSHGRGRNVSMLYFSPHFIHTNGEVEQDLRRNRVS
ncbi:hypothetical protein KFK09_014149 [Dendrobium nobile]|uniref:Uncharacterized protein n=1 Tax=Dendrobium nobile TaxID=94219 RepID=A0A8T3B9C3_DENNO|nr:hypothetical protein KFK09_014149 [Dendrobium nobile]